MNDVRWNPGPLQLVVPVAVHAVGCAALLIVSRWYPPFAWALIAVTASLAFQLRLIAHAWRKRIELKVIDNRLWLANGGAWQPVELDQIWLGPYLVVLRRTRPKKDAWWIFRAELSSSDDALLRRTLRSTGDGLKHVQGVEHRAP